MLFRPELKKLTPGVVTSKRIWGENHQIEVAMVSTVGNRGLLSAPESVPKKKKVLATRSLASNCVPLAKPF